MATPAPIIDDKFVPDDRSAADDKSGPAVDAKPQPLNMEEEFSKDAQFGVQRVEATAMVWSKAHLITAYVM
jgi:hypothetical protein